MPSYSFEDDLAKGKQGFSFVDEPPKKPEATALTRAQAAAAGVNRGFYSDLMGIPVDTMANVIDLAKAGLGSGYQAISGKPVPDVMLPYDRTKIPGTADWIATKFREHGMGGAIDNPNPEDTASRILHMGGRVAGQSVVPNPGAEVSLAQNAANMGKGAVSGLLAGSVGEVAPAWAGVAGMAPQLASMYGAGALKRALRGDELGRQAMEQRMQDLRAGGINEPSAGLATGNRTLMGVENILSQTPGSVAMYENARARNLEGMKQKAQELRDRASKEYGPIVAGEAIQGDIKGPFIDRFKNTQGKLYDAVDAAIPSASKANVQATADALTDLTSSIEGAPNIGNRFINGRITDINEAFRLDTGLDQRSGGLRSTAVTIPGQESRAPSSVTRTIDPRAQGSGEGLLSAMSPSNVYGPRVRAQLPDAEMRSTTITIPGKDGRSPITVNRSIDPLASVAGEGTWRPPAEPTLPYAAVSKLRTQVGNELDGNMLTSDVPRSQWKRLYGALSEDMGGAAASAGPQATQAWERANGYTKRGIDKIDDLSQLANRSTPEGAFGAVSNSLNSGPSVYKRLRGALTPDARGKVVATIIDEMGTAAPGQQGVTGDTWSPRSFLTNYNRIDAGGRKELFKRIPGGAQMAEDLASIAKTADMLGDASKIWANPSGTANTAFAKGTLGTIAAGVGGGVFYTPLLAPAATAAGGLVAANQFSQRLLLNPKFVNWLAKAPQQATPTQVQAYSQRLIANAKMTNDPQFQKDVADYLESASQGK